MATASPKSTLATALAAGVTILLGATPVGAQQANPEPTSCAGVAFTDAAGDHTATRENLDLKAGFFRYVTNSAGENVLTANLQVTNLDETLQPRAHFHSWTFRWTSGTTRQYVRAILHSRNGVSFSHRTEGVDGPPGGTTGRLFSGKDGIIEIVVPVAKLGLAGKRLTDLHAFSEVAYSDPLHYYVLPADRAPDSQTGGKPFEVVPCAQQATATAPQPTTAPAQAAGPPRLDVKVLAGKLSARKVNQRRSFSIRLRASEKTTALQARLQRGRLLAGAQSDRKRPTLVDLAR